MKTKMTISHAIRNIPYHLPSKWICDLDSRLIWYLLVLYSNSKFVNQVNLGPRLVMHAWKYELLKDIATSQLREWSEAFCCVLLLIFLTINVHKSFALSLPCLNWLGCAKLAKYLLAAAFQFYINQNHHKFKQKFFAVKTSLKSILK